MLVSTRTSYFSSSLKYIRALITPLNCIRGKLTHSFKSILLHNSKHTQLAKLTLFQKFQWTWAPLEENEALLFKIFRADLRNIVHNKIHPLSDNEFYWSTASSAELLQHFSKSSLSLRILLAHLFKLFLIFCISLSFPQLVLRRRAPTPRVLKAGFSEPLRQCHSPPLC